MNAWQSLVNHRWVQAIVAGTAAGIVGTALFQYSPLGHDAKQPALPGPQHRAIGLQVFPSSVRLGQVGGTTVTIYASGMTASGSYALEVNLPAGGTFSGGSGRISAKGKVAFPVRFPGFGDRPIETGAYKIQMVDDATGEAAFAYINVTR